MIYDCYEIWVHESSDLPYILIVCPQESKSERIQIIDPKDNNVKNMSDYETAQLWLWEDEFTLVDGRMTID